VRHSLCAVSPEENNRRIASLIRYGFVPEVRDGYGAHFPRKPTISAGARELITKMLDMNPTVGQRVQLGVSVIPLVVPLSLSLKDYLSVTPSHRPAALRRASRQARC
jgi:hypothetical protein